MQVETLKDVLHWTREFHKHLAYCLDHCADKNESERAKLLLNYLGEHEHKLENALAGFEETANESVLNTWCYEYLDKRPIKRHLQCEAPLAQLKSTEIITEIVNLHQQVIDLYSYLHSKAITPSSQELLGQLVEHEVMRIVHSANRLEDL